MAAILTCPLTVWSGDDSGPLPGLSHHSVSVVPSVDRHAGFLAVKPDNGQALQLSVDRAIAGDRLETIRPGDIIREECVKDKRGILEALSIRLVRSAPKEIGTPEL